MTFEEWWDAVGYPNLSPLESPQHAYMCEMAWLAAHAAGQRAMQERAAMCAENFSSTHGDYIAAQIRALEVQDA